MTAINNTHKHVIFEGICAREPIEVLLVFDIVLYSNCAVLANIFDINNTSRQKYIFTANVLLLLPNDIFLKQHVCSLLATFLWHVVINLNSLYFTNY